MLNRIKFKKARNKNEYLISGLEFNEVIFIGVIVVLAMPVLYLQYFHQFLHTIEFYITAIMVLSLSIIFSIAYKFEIKIDNKNFVFSEKFLWITYRKISCPISDIENQLNSSQKKTSSNRLKIRTGWNYWDNSNESEWIELEYKDNVYVIGNKKSLPIILNKIRFALQEIHSRRYPSDRSM